MATARKKRKKASKSAKAKKTKRVAVKRAGRKSAARKPKKSTTARAKKSRAPEATGGTELIYVPASAPKEEKEDKLAGVVLEFTKDDKSPTDVRVTLLKPKDRVLKQGEKTGKSLPRPPGDVDALVEVKVPSPTGPGRTATIVVTNVTAPEIVLTVPAGQTSAEGVATLTVVEEKKA